MGRFYNLQEGRFQGSSSNKESVNVVDSDQFLAVVLRYTASVDDSAVSGNWVDTGKISANPAVDLPDLLCGCCLACADGPDWLVGKDDVLPIVDNVLNCVQLTLNNLDGAIFLPFLEGFSEAEDNLQLILEGVLNLLCNDLVCLSEVRPPFRVSDDHPADIDILDLFGCHLASKGSKRIGRAVLSSNLYLLILFGEHDSN